jgi:molybdopterin biosynthesis enzyme
VADRVKPGKPLAFGKCVACHRTAGNPVSAVTFLCLPGHSYCRQALDTDAAFNLRAEFDGKPDQRREFLRVRRTSRAE